MLTLAAATFLTACGDDEPSSDANERAGTYQLDVLNADFPTEQRLGKTSLLRLGARNTGEKIIPALTVTISIAGEEGQNSSLPFAIRDPQPGLAQPNRPVWVLAARYPKRSSDSAPGGAETSNQKTFDFGPLKPGHAIEAVWKLTAVRTGDFELLYQVGAGLSDEVKTETSRGVEPGGTIGVEISSKTPNTIVTDSGEVVEIPNDKQHDGG